MSMGRKKYTKNLSNLLESLGNLKNDTMKNGAQIEGNFIRKHEKLKEEICKTTSVVQTISQMCLKSIESMSKGSERMFKTFDKISSRSESLCSENTSAMKTYVYLSHKIINQIDEEINLQREQLKKKVFLTSFTEARAPSSAKSKPKRDSNYSGSAKARNDSRSYNYEHQDSDGDFSY